MRITRIARERTHTLRFLDEIRGFAPVFLDTEIDMTGVLAHRDEYRADGRRLSIVTYLLHAAANTLAEHPEANAAVRGPRVARYGSVNGKLTLDKTLNGHRIVLATVLPDVQDATLEEIQEHIEQFRDGDPATQPEFAAVRLLHRLPWPLAPLLYRLGVRPLSRRPETMGTFAVTSLGHRPVDGFYSVGGTTVTFGLGRITDRPVARAGQVVIAPVMRLCLTFDHRVIDGAEAADVLTEVKDRMEAFAPARVLAAVQ
ncbi:2-oxo acid dehydrogenase subunit E2 [Actinocrispum wychmicini]|uniref:2-oxoacid dehydrogenase/acyltransferase catalytic subunit n=1 Tax=Actinocrispum wychmicini TaxID=1213861 RepID=A0A4R2JPT4_9PSEU|nr:2-oxo acid dehydrogenase subunit E2 [Actinocrispum wychmicini]TCO60792.1 2-oxoacid dehydrogenase/acyltransferase catalytic subunit [Actinocrispum wychmicini]